MSKNRFIIFCLLVSTAAYWTTANSVQAQSAVVVTEVVENIPTYLIGPPDPNPMFFFGRGTQGAEQRIYPYPLFDNLTNIKADQNYDLVYLENEYVKIGIAPELGGKLFSAVDKTNNYDFIYRQHVIKPALIGLTGAWISGGVEWNIPHHHRATTLQPVQYRIEESADGSKTVWLGELEIRHRMRWTVGYTLRPGSSVVECSVRISNRTPVEHTMLCFANIAVHIDENYQVIFPPHTQLATSHSKRKFYDWPMVDGVDVSWYKNNRRGSSWFAVNDIDDFVAGYDHGKRAGIVNVANHHIVSGKKFFTWGVGNMWDDILTDDDGPYLEIMVGAYSDNQPDYSWLQPYEERSFVTKLFPFRELGGIKQATEEAAVNLEVKAGKASFGFYTTKAFPDAVVRLKAGDRVLLEKHISIDPAHPYVSEQAVPGEVEEAQLRVSISAGGKELVAYSPVQLPPAVKPEPYEEPKAPRDFENVEELFLAGQRIDQFHSPTHDADPYWEEVLRRDPGHIAANTGMGLLRLRNADYPGAEAFFNKAIARLTDQFTSPKNVEPLYYLGVALKAQGRLDEAYTAFYKATWKQEWKAPAYYALAEIATTRGNYQTALDLIGHALDANAWSVRAYVLKSALLRHLGRKDEAAKVLTFALEKCDPLDTQLMAEDWLVNPRPANAELLFSTLRIHPANAQEIAAGYLQCGLWEDGAQVLSALVESTADKTSVSPIVYYYLAYFADQTGESATADEYRKQAARQPLDYVFPFQQEAIKVLESAIAANPRDARAAYYLGNLLYDWQPERATRLWEVSADLDPSASITWRNLAVAYSHQETESAMQMAIRCLERAVDLPDPLPTHLSELDHLYQEVGAPVNKRLAMLEKHQQVVMTKDETLGALINLKIFAGETSEAISLMENRIFSLWEGGSDFNGGEAWAIAHLIQGIRCFEEKMYQEAVTAFQSALNPPGNLRAERESSKSNQIKYWTGCAFERLGEAEEAKAAWEGVTAIDELETLPRMMRKNGVLQAQAFFAALARQRLDPDADVQPVFNKLVDVESNMILPDKWSRDYQFVRVNRKVTLQRQAYPHYLAGLGHLGLGDVAKAKKAFEEALAISPDFFAPKIELDQL